MVHPRYVLRLHVLGNGKYTTQIQINFINIKCRMSDYMFRPFLFYYSSVSMNPSRRIHGGLGAVLVDGCNRGAGKSLARPGRKKDTATEDFEFHISYL